MSLTVALLLAGAVGYLLGSISTGILYSRSLGRDIRTQGSKNSGATNMTRVHGFGKGMLTFLGDCVKGVLASLFGLWLGSKAAAPDGGTYAQLCACVGGTCAVLGHIWPAFFGFKGGKGVATCIGPFAAGQKEKAASLVNAGVMAQLQSTAGFSKRNIPDPRLVSTFLTNERTKIADSYEQLLVFLRNLLQ